MECLAISNGNLSSFFKKQIPVFIHLKFCLLLYTSMKIWLNIILVLGFVLGSLSSLIAQDSIAIDSNTQTSMTITDSLNSTDSSMMDDSSLSQIIVPPQSKPQSEQKDGNKKTAQQNTTGIFYFLLALVFTLGLLRKSDANFYKHLFQSFISTKTSVRSIKSKISQRNLLHFILLVLFYVCAGLYLYYVIKIFAHPAWYQRWSMIVLVAGFALGILMIYLIRIGFLKLLGWLFNLKNYTEEYIFNINMVNQVFALILIPFLFLIVFSHENIAKIIAIFSFFIWFLAIVNRYARSRDSIGQMIRANKFHFFLYLCASEIMPFAILAKLVMNGY